MLTNSVLSLNSFPLQVLSDKEKREIYDRYGEDGLKNDGSGFRSSQDIFGRYVQCTFCQCYGPVNESS